MTIINGIEIDNIRYIKNKVKETISNNKPIEDKLHVIAVISNPCLYAKRYILMKEFIYRMGLEDHVELYIVELAYGDQKFIITERGNKKHLQIRTETPLWHKENMINLGVKYLLPKDYRAFAWIDADLEFENNNWAQDTLRVLNGQFDIVQLFSQCMDLDNNNDIMNISTSGGYFYSNNKRYNGKQPNFWHPGYAWAITRDAYERIGGLYDKGILGSGDHIMMFSLLNMGLKSVNDFVNEEYKQDIINFQSKMKNLRYGYVPGVIKHYFHGSKKNRKYSERCKILIEHDYSPKMITYDSVGIIVPSEAFSKQFKADILNYFSERNEDE